MWNRKSTTPSDDYWVLVREVFSPEDDMQLLHIIDKFSMTDYFWFTLEFTRMINEIFSFLQKMDQNKYKEMQAYFLVYTVQLIYQIYLHLASPLEAQRTQSLKVLSKILYKNKYAVRVVLRIFKKSLFSQVDTANELLKNYNWGEDEWISFFKNVLMKNYDTAIVQWNDQIKKELVIKIKKEVDNFVKAKMKHKQAIQGHIGELNHPSHKYAAGHLITSSVNNLRWNFDEFRVSYKADQDKFLVWKFYLARLLHEGDEASDFKPKLEIEIKKTQINEFWEELIVKFMTSEREEEKEIILKVLILLYQKYFLNIKEVRTLPYWLKILQLQQFRKQHFLILQFLIAALSVQNSEIQNENYNIFKEADGLRVTFCCLNQCYKELKDIKFKKLSPIRSEDDEEDLIQLKKVENLRTDQKKMKLKNYTQYLVKVDYFDQSKNISIGILVFKILDLLMSKEINREIYPLPKAKVFLLENNHIAILCQLLLIQNIELSKEVLGFIKNHMNSQYILYHLKDSGLIEFLLIYLDTELADESFTLLKDLQDVAIGYNEDLNYQSQLNKNDTKIIREDKDFDFQNSIFLRYWPLPMIKKACFKQESDFLDLFKQISFEKANLIWNGEMRIKMKESILDNSRDLIEELLHFAQLREKLDDFFAPDFPKYNKKLEGVIKYNFIEEEVRCGKYYLRVWIQRKNNDPDFFRIPQAEEDEFLKNLKQGIQTIINKEQSQEEDSDQKKLLILLKACLLALQSFQNKKILCLSEIKQILLMIMTKHCTIDHLNYIEAEFTEILKKIMHIATKTLSKAIEKDSQNLKEVSEFEGIELMDQVRHHIIENSQKPYVAQNLDMSKIAETVEDNSIDLPMSYDERMNKLQQSTISQNKGQGQHQLQLDFLGAKTLKFCILAISKLISHDFNKFISSPFEFRVNLFKQMAKILDLSYQIYNGYKLQRQLQQEKALSIQAFNTYQINQSIQDMSMSFTQQKNPIMNNLRQFYKQHVQPTPVNQNAKSFNFATSSDIKQPHTEQSLTKSILLRSNQKTMRNKLLQIDFTGEKQSSEERRQVLDLIFTLTRCILEHCRTLSLNPSIHPELIKSGLAWKCLQHCFFSLWQEKNEKQGIVNEFLLDSVFILQHLTSFAYQLTHQLQSTTTNIPKENPYYLKTMERFEDRDMKDIIIEFWFGMKKLLEKKILENLIVEFVFEQFSPQIRMSQYQEREAKKFLKIFSIVQERTPEQIWNDQSREELSVILSDQLKNIDTSFYDLIRKFDYSINIQELRIEGIFVKQFNSDVHFRPSDVNQFVKSLLDQLEKRIGDQYLSDLSETEFDNVLEITKALRNLIQYQNILNLSSFDFDYNISLFSSILKTKELDLGGGLDQRLNNIAGIIMDIMKTMSKSSRISEDLINNLEFNKLVTRILYGGERKFVDNDVTFMMVQILQNILNFDLASGGPRASLDTSKISRNYDIETEPFLIKNGMVVFLLNLIFDSQQSRKIRVEVTKILRSKFDEVSQVLATFMPVHFFTMMTYYKRKGQFEEEVIRNFLNYLDDQQYENVFVMWNSDLKEQQHAKIRSECEKIINELNKWKDDFDQFESNLTLEPFHNPIVIHEIIIQNAILRIYNKNPSIYIATEMDNFLTNLCLKFDKQVFCLQEILNIFHNNELDFEANNDEHIVKVRQEIFIVKQVRKKFKYECAQALQVLTAILLTIEQQIFNCFNPNKPRNKQIISEDTRSSVRGSRQGEVMNQREQQALMHTALFSRIYQQLQSQKGTTEANPKQNLPQQRSSYVAGQQSQPDINMLALMLVDDANKLPAFYHECLSDWLISNVFTNQTVPTELRLTFLQLVLLSLEIPNNTRDLEDYLLNFTGVQIQRIIDVIDKKTIEDIMVLGIVEKMLSIGGSKMIQQFYNFNTQQNFENLKRIHQMNKRLSTMVEHIFILMSQLDVCKERFQQLSQTDREIPWGDILKPKPYQKETAQEFIKLWRNKPANANDAKKIYSHSENMYLEDKLDEHLLQKMKHLPLISKRAMEEIKRDILMSENELPIYNLIEDLESLEQKEKFWNDNRIIDIDDFE